jgi:transmembrane sensor
MTDAAACLPNDQALRQQAVAWCTLLCSGQATASDHAAWQQWHQHHPDHQRAWQRLESVRGILQTIPPQIGAPVLQAQHRGRRQALRGLALLASGGALGYAVYRGGHDTAPWRAALADHRTAVGQQRSVRLADGALVILNTGSAIDVRFSPGKRTVLLHAGEILVETAHQRQPGAPVDPRPFVVETADGAIEALGTRFTVRRYQDRTEVVVLEHAVAVRLPPQQDRPLLVRAGQRLDFNAVVAGPVQAADGTAALWRDGSIVVDDWPLARLLAELDRYRPGHLACDPAVAAMRVSGAFPVRDTDQALAVLARSLPVRVRRLTRYWVSVGPA